MPATATDIRERTANRLWARLTAASMIAAPALLLAGNALHPVNHKQDEGEFLAGVAAHETQWYVAHLLIFIGLPLFVPAVVGLVRQVGDRAPLLGAGGATLTVGGVFGAEAYVTVEGFVQWTMTSTAGAEREQMAAVLERFNTAAGTFIPTGLGTIAFALGLAMLAVAILRARLLPMGYPLTVLASRVLAIGGLLIGAPRQGGFDDTRAKDRRSESSRPLVSPGTQACEGQAYKRRFPASAFIGTIGRGRLRTSTYQR